MNAVPPPLFEALFDTAPGGLAVLTGANFVIRRVNHAYQSLLPRPHANPVGRTFAEVWGKSDGSAERRAALEKALETGQPPCSLTCELRTADGSLRAFTVTAQMVEHNGERILLEALWEVSPAKSAEQERAQLMEQLQAEKNRAWQPLAQTQQHALELDAIIESMSDPVLVYDPTGLIIRVNHSAVRAYGFDPTGMNRDVSVLRLNVRDADGRLVESKKLPSARALSGEAVNSEPLEITNEQGVELIYQVSAAPIIAGGVMTGVVSIWHNVTERDRLLAENHRQAERFRDLANSMPQLVWMATPDGAVDYYNQRYKEYDGIQPDTSQTWAWAPVLHPEDAAASMHAWQIAVATGTPYQAEHRVRMADGSYRWHLSRGIPVHDENGNIARWYGTATDIHSYKIAEEKLKNHTARLERSNRDLQEFAFVASHDLQEPLRKIEAFGDVLLQRSAALDERQRDLIARLRQSAQRMREMIDGLLQLSRLNTHALAFTPVDLSQTAAEALADLEAALQRSGGSVSIAALPVVDGDPIQLRRLFQNLIDNALKFQPKQGQARVHIYTRQPDHETVEIYVQDNGIGFDMEHASRLFQPFQRLVGRGEYEGSGIGLSICRRIVERHAGEIRVVSQEDQGTTFVIRLPIHQKLNDQERGKTYDSAK